MSNLIRTKHLILGLLLIQIIEFIKSETIVLDPISTNANNVNQYRGTVYGNGGQSQQIYPTAPASSNSIPRDGTYDPSVQIAYYPSKYGNSNNYYVPPIRQKQSSSFGDGFGLDSFGGGGDGLGGIGELGGAVGLLGLIGLAGIAIWIFFPILLLIPIVGPILPIIVGPLLLLALLPILLPVLAPVLIILLPLLLLFLPVPVITLPPVQPGRSAATTLAVGTARALLESSVGEDCAARITCEIAAAARTYDVDPDWVTNFNQNSSSNLKWSEKISSAWKSTDCRDYKCGILKPVKKLFKLYN